MKRIFTLVLLSFCFIHLGFSQNNNVIDPELYELMNSRSSDKISVNIILKKQINASELNLRKSYSSKDAMRKGMMEEMKYQAEKNQADVVKTLQASERSSQVTDINCHWLTNMINCKATADAILKIAEHPDVKAIIYNKKEYMLFDEKKESGTPNRAYNGTNVEKINAHKVWEMGFTGDGIIVAVLDTGVNTDHVDLKNHLWDDGNGHHGVNTLVGDPYFPQYTDRYDVSDAEGHGTHCAGTVCGDGTSGTITGMAPDAELMCVKVLGDEGEGTLETILAGVEYAVENGADVLSMSLGISGPTDLVNEVVREAFENMLPLDVVAAVAAGNDGAKQGEYPIPYNINAPASCPPPYLSPDQTEVGGKTNVICVGAVDYSDQSCGFSSEGPVTWQKTKYGDYKLEKVYSTTALQYDNGTYSENLTVSAASDCFGVMFPPSKLSGFADGSVLASVSIYDAVSDAGFIEIFSGGNTPSEGTKVHSQTYQLDGTKSMVDINILTDVNIDKTKNLWVIFTSYTSSKPVPVTTKNNQADANGCWVYKNGSWSNNSIITKKSIMVRANISTGAAIEEHIGLIRPDICAPGYNIQSASNTDNEWYDWLSGTSMATPCVAGAIALLLDANPDLTPAKICEALETTAVKVEGATAKNNKTGSGRIDIYNALLSVVDLPLSAPTLTATATSSSAINLSWTTAPGATSYTVYRGGTQIASNLTSTSYSDTGLNPETQYCYQVKAIKGSETATSNESCATTLAEGAAPGTGKYRIKAVERSEAAGVSYYLNIENNTQHASGSKGGVGLATKADNDSQIFEIETIYGSSVYFKSATGYYIYCQTWNVDAYSTTTGTSLEMQDAGKGDNTFYIYSAKGYFKVDLDSGGSGKYYPYSDGGTGNRQRWILEEVGSSTPDPDPTPTVPNAPATLTATAQSSSVINLSWSTVADATSYNVYRGLTKIASVATGTTYSDTGLTPNTEYCYTVTSVNDAGESTKMNEACARTLTAVTMPGAFTLTATAQSSSAIELSWTASSGATSYDVYRATLKIATGLTTTSFTDTGLNSNQEYCYSIVAVNTAGMTESNVVCATTQSENAGGGGEGVVEIGFPATGNNGRLPIYTYYEYSYSQQIYTKAEIDPDGTKVGSMITKIAYKQQNSVAVDRNIVVYMQNTTKASFASTKDWTAVSGYKVFEGSVKLLGENQYLEIRLDDPLEYEGNNLLISVFDNTNASVPAANFYSYNAGSRALRLFNMVSFDPTAMGTRNGTLDATNSSIDITFEAAAEVIPFPQNVKATPANIFVDQSTTISWDACDGATSYNVYVNGVKHGSSATTSYVLSNLPYNVNPGIQINVTAVVNGNESEMSKFVFVKVGGYFPLTINVVDNQGNPMDGVSVELDGYDEIGNAISRTFTTDANGSISVAKMPMPLYNNCYNIEATKSIWKGYADVCDYNNPPMDVVKDVEYVVEIVMGLPSSLSLHANKYEYSVDEDIELWWRWESEPTTTPVGFNLYEKYWDNGISSYVYEKINTSLIPSNVTDYTIVGGLPTRGCDNTICLTAVYTEGETTKGQPSVTLLKTGTGTMEGIAIDENDNALADVTITVRGTDCQGTTYEYTYTTGADGKFSGDMPMGIYTVFASKPGYSDRAIYDVEIVHDKVTNVIVGLWIPGEENEIEREIGENTEPYVSIYGPVLPISTGYLYSASQQIYTKEELNFASATDVKITSISFRVYGNINSGKTDAVEIFMQNTDKAEFANLRDWIQVTYNDIVFNGEYEMPSDGEWLTFEFDTPFVYTGGNVVVGVKRHEDALQQSGFYVYNTENIRSLCGANDTHDPVNNYTDATALYKLNTIKITYTSTSPEIVATPNPIEFGEVIVGDYWTEKPDATAHAQLKAYNTKFHTITLDNPFFTLPTLDLTRTVLDFDLGYNRNNVPGFKAGTLSVTSKIGIVKDVKVTATAYDPVEPDVFEKSREVVWVNDEYEDTPAITTLHDDYILPGEIEEGVKKDAVYKFTLEADAYVTAKIFNGKAANLAFYKEDFANDDVDKDGPSYDNAYYGTGGAPVEPIDICILGDDCDGTLPGWTFYNADGQYSDRGWFVKNSGGWGGRSGDNEGDWALGSETYYYGKLKTENYVYTTYKYEITDVSEIHFYHKYSSVEPYHRDMFDVVVSLDGITFESVYHVEYEDFFGDDVWFEETVSLAAYKGKQVHIGFGHIDKRDEDVATGVKIDDVCINGVLEISGDTESRMAEKTSRASGNVIAFMENLLFPKGTYYVVAAAEEEFTLYLTKRNVDEGIIFTGVGNWKNATNWNISAVPQPKDDVIIRGDAVVDDDVEINSIFIESTATLTIESTGVLEVTNGIKNNIPSAFIIEDGGQLYQNAADVAATFNMNINNPASWGPDGSNHTQGWQFIASPFLDADMLNYVVTDDGDYDLYKYDGTQELEWVNYKLHHDEFSHDFADGMQGWTVVDANNDGFSWSYNSEAGNDGAAGYLSCVFRQGKSNDFLVSPKLINTYPESKLRFWVKNAEKVTTTNELEVWLSADKSIAPTTEEEFVTKVKTIEVTNTWQQIEILLEDYANQDDRDFMEYWIAIRSKADGSSNTEVLIDKLELANYDEPNPYETEFVLGRGYMASYEKDGTASLQGTLNYDTTFNYKVAFSDAKRWENFYLIGNPFTYNINWTDFIHSNIVDGFAVVDNDGSYVYEVDAEIKVGDGIMIQTTGANPTISVTKNTRNEVADYINVVASGSEGDDNFIVSLSGDEYEGFKKLENFNENISQVYVSEYGTHYGIVNRDADVEEIEFCFDVKKMGYYTISVTPNGDFSSVILYDRVEDVETEMLTGGGYRFMAQNANDNYDRFVLKLAKKPADEDIFVYQSGDELIVNAEGLVQIIDVMGRIIYSGNQNGVNRINVSGMENSACMIRNINNNEVRTQKIVIL